MTEKFESKDIINRQEFLELREYLRRKRLYEPHESLAESKDYVFTRSSLEKLMPSLDKEAVSGMYHRINYNKGLAWIQQRNIHDSFNEVTEQGDMSFVNDINTPRIYCTFHLASYRMPLFKILEKGIDLAIVLASNTLKQQHESLTLVHEELRKKHGLTNTFTFIDAESPTGAIQMVRTLKEGKSLFFYIDGNTGVGGIKRNDDKMLPINFFGAKMLARKGVAYIANKCKVPIVTTVCNYVSDEEMIVNYYPPINPLDNPDINETSRIVTQSIYDNFSELLKKHPDQWDGWISLPNFLDTRDFLQENKDTSLIDKNRKYFFHKARFYHFNYKNGKYLLDKGTFQIYPINQELSDILKIHDKFIYEKNILPQDVFEFLVKKEILIDS